MSRWQALKQLAEGPKEGGDGKADSLKDITSKAVFSVDLKCNKDGCLRSIIEAFMHFEILYMPIINKEYSWHSHKILFLLMCLNLYNTYYQFKSGEMPLLPF